MLPQHLHSTYMQYKSDTDHIVMSQSSEFHFQEIVATLAKMHSRLHASSRYPHGKAGWTSESVWPTRSQIKMRCSWLKAKNFGRLGIGAGFYTKSVLEHLFHRRIDIAATPNDSERPLVPPSRRKLLMIALQEDFALSSVSRVVFGPLGGWAVMSSTKPHQA